MSSNQTKISDKGKLLLVDLDDTLIDTSEYKKLLFKLLSKRLSISKDRVRSEYLELGELTGQNGWIGKLIDRLVEVFGADKEKIIRECIEIVRNLPVIDKILKHSIDSSKYKIIFTQGDRELQQAKISYHKLDRHFDDTIIVSGDKVEFLKSRMSDNELNLRNRNYYDVEIIDNKVGLFSGLEKYSCIKIIDADSIIKKAI
jgi:FMN phosphatase YigB (HAD superfamily)